MVGEEPFTMNLRELRLNIKPGPGRPSRVPLGKVTIVKGDHGVGKTRLEQGLSFALRGGIHDVALRHATFVKDAGLLLRATLPTEPCLYGEVAIADGSKTTTYRREMKITRDEDSGVLSGGRPSQKALPWGIDPDRVLPIADIEASLTKRPDEVRAAYLDRVAAVGSEGEIARKIADLLGSVASDLALEELSLPATLESLRSLRTTCRARLTLTSDTLIGLEESVTAIEGTLPPQPDAEREAYFEAMANFLQKRGEVQEATQALVSSQANLTNARTNLDTLAPPPGERPVAPELPQETPAAPVTFTPAAPAPRLENPFHGHRSVQLWILTNTVRVCPICAHEIDFAKFGAQMVVTQTAAAALDEASTRLAALPSTPPPAAVAPGISPARAAYNEAHRLWAEATQAWERKQSARSVAEAEIQRLQGSLTANQQRVGDLIPVLTELGEKLLAVQGSAGDDKPQDVITALDAAQSAPRWFAAATEYQGRIRKLAQDRGSWETYRTAKARRDDLRGKKPRLQSIVEACDTAIKVLLKSGVEAFLARMTAYMVPGWEPLILLQDERGSDSFALVVRVDGVINYDPSGMQALNLLYAFAIALFERDPTPLMVLVSPVERPVSSKYLPKLAKALSAAPEGVQIILTTTSDVPKKGMPKGTVVLDLDDPESIEKALTDPGGQGTLFTETTPD